MERSYESDTRSGTQEFVDWVSYFDTYGFAVFVANTPYQQMDERCHSYSRPPEGSATVSDAWKKVLLLWDSKETVSEAKLQKLVSAGVPNAFRGKIWKYLLDVNSLAYSSSFRYQENVVTLRECMVQLGVTEFNTSKAQRDLGKLNPRTYKCGRDSLPISTLQQIFLDVDRTFCTHVLFLGNTPAAIESRAALFRILAVYATFNPGVSYCQGMSYIAAMFLLFMSEEEAFWCLVALMERPKYLQGYFDITLEKIQSHAQVFDRIMHRKVPKVRNHLTDLDIDPLLYITPWFMSLYTSLPCWDAVLFIWDTLMLEGVQAIFRVGLAIMELLEDKLTDISDPNRAIPMIQRLSPDVVSLDALLPAVSKTSVEKWEITSLNAVVTEQRQAVEKRQSGKSPRSPVAVPPKLRLSPRLVKTVPTKQRLKGLKKSALYRRLQGIFSSKPEASVIDKPVPVPKLQIQYDSGSSQTLVVQSPPRSPTPRFLRAACRSAGSRSPLAQNHRGSLRATDGSPGNISRLFKSSAILQHSFAEFHSSEPFRTSKEKSVPRSPFSRTPEVELKTIRRKGPMGRVGSKCRRSLASAGLRGSPK